MIDRRSIFTATAAIGTFVASAFSSKKTRARMGQRIIRKALRTKRFNPASRRVAKMNKALRR